MIYFISVIDFTIRKELYKNNLSSLTANSRPRLVALQSGPLFVTVKGFSPHPEVAKKRERERERKIERGRNKEKNLSVVERNFFLSA